MKRRSARLKPVTLLSGLVVAATLMTPTIGLTQDAKSDTGVETAKPAPVELAPKFYASYGPLIAASNGLLPVEEGPEYVGSSMLPFGSRNKAIDEAKANALKSKYKLFVLTYDREERQQTAIVSGIARVIKLRGVVLVEKTPENVIKLVEDGSTTEIGGLLSDALEQPAFASLTPRLRALVQTNQGRTRGGFPVGRIVRALISQGDNTLPADLKKWAKYHGSDDVRQESYYGLVKLGELDFVEEAIKGEQDKAVKLRVTEKIRNARLGG